MMSWIEESTDGLTTITVYNQHGTAVATIIEEEDAWVFDLGIASPGDLRISKTDLDDPVDWVQAYIGNDIVEIELDPAESRPFLSFVDDETKAVWQVWEILDGDRHEP